MTNQQVVIKVTMQNNQKKVRKAMKIAATISGVYSVKFLGTDKEQIAVTGEGIDPVELTQQLRKSVGHTELLSVGPVKEEKAASAKETKETQARFEYVCYPPPPYYGQFMPPYQVVHEAPCDCCTIL